MAVKFIVQLNIYHFLLSSALYHFRFTLFCAISPQGAGRRAQGAGRRVQGAECRVQGAEKSTCFSILRQRRGKAGKKRSFVQCAAAQLRSCAAAQLRSCAEVFRIVEGASVKIKISGYATIALL
jgi:hypothetical protein